MRIWWRRLRASASVSPACASSGSVKVTHGNGVVADAHRQPEQRVPDHQAGVIIGGMGELQLAGGGIADGVDAAVAGLELAVDGDAGVVVAHAGGFEAETVERRLAAGGDQQMRAFDGLARRRAPASSR